MFISCPECGESILIVPDLDGQARLVALHIKACHDDLDERSKTRLIIDFKDVLSVFSFDVSPGGLLD